MNISTKTKIIGISAITLFIASLVFFALSLFFFSTSTNLSSDFLALAFLLDFIELFVIMPKTVDILFDP